MLQRQGHQHRLRVNNYGQIGVDTYKKVVATNFDLTIIQSNSLCVYKIENQDIAKGFSWAVVWDKSDFFGFLWSSRIFLKYLVFVC